MQSDSPAGKQQVHDFWNEAACGEALYLPSEDREGYETQARIRYALEPHILEFAGFDEAKRKRVLEVGVGLGADHQRFAEGGADLFGIDLTAHAIEQTKQRFSLMGLHSHLSVGDAENLDFRDNFFDIVYSYGVIHHSPDTPRCVAEIHRVLRPGGVARVMIYHKWSLIGFMLWARYALFALRPWRSLREIYASHLESPGTKAYSVGEGRHLFRAFRDVHIRIVMSHADLLTSRAGQRHRGVVLSIARVVWPRWILRRFFRRFGVFMLIEATK